MKRYEFVNFLMSYILLLGVQVKVLKCIQPLTVEHLLIGQYSKSLDGSKPAYLDDETVPKGSLTPTYAACTLYINNERWSGVPFILKAGKGMEFLIAAYIA
jgi:glucose-6-phosphate 1-dehydrogenase